MVINQLMELSMIVDTAPFHRIFNAKTSYLKELDDEYLDTSLAAKGITVIYRDSRYKKRVRILVNAGMVVDHPTPTNCSVSWVSASLNTSITNTSWMTSHCPV